MDHPHTPACDCQQLVLSEIKEVKDALLGDYDSPGLVERVRRLEHSDRSRRWWQKTTAVAFVTVVAGTVWGWVTGGK